MEGDVTFPITAGVDAVSDPELPECHKLVRAQKRHFVKYYRLKKIKDPPFLLTAIFIYFHNCSLVITHITETTSFENILYKIYILYKIPIWP